VKVSGLSEKLKCKYASFGHPEYEKPAFKSSIPKALFNK